MPTEPESSSTDPSTAAASSRTQGATLLLGTWARIVNNPSAMIIANSGALSLLRLLSNVILARLLAPSAFALSAITALILTGIQMISDVGIAITALREGEMSRADEDRLWTMQLIRGLGVGALAAAAAVPVGWIYANAQLRDVLFALAVMPALQGAQSLYPVLALAHRRLLPSTMVEIGGRLVTMALSILFALANPTVWALVIGTLVGSAFTAVAGHLFARRLPRLVIDRAYIARQWRFSRWIQASSTFTFLSAQIDKAVLPFMFGMSALGVYGIGVTFAAMPAQITQRWSASVFYPLTVELLRGDAAARAQLMAVRTTMLLYSAIVTLAVMAVSPAFFLLLYASRYHPAAGIACIVAIGTFFEVAESSLRHLPLVEGSPRFEVWAVLVRMAAFTAGVLVVYQTGAGIVGYALSFSAGLAASHLFMLWIDVRRGYLRPGFDVLTVATLVVAGTVIYLLPLGRAGTLGLVAEGIAVAVLAGAAMLVVYQRRGLPSLPANAAPPVLRDTVNEELGLRLEGV